MTESGDNYIRFSNGLQICYDYIEIHNPPLRQVDGSKENVLFPVPFINGNIYITCTRDCGGFTADLVNNSPAVWYYHGHMSTIGFQVCGDPNADKTIKDDLSTNYMYFSYIAIGKWK